MFYLWLFLAFAYGYLISIAWHGAKWTLREIIAGVFFGWWAVPIVYVSNYMYERFRSIYGWIKANW